MTCLISVVVCTYNRADDLAVALRTLCAQAVDPALYEILVVDNNSTDQTRAVTAEWARRCPHVRYVRETQQGLSHARNRGWRAAQGTYVAYTDDDCKLPPQWLRVAAEIISERAPAVFGGPYFPFHNTPVPRWFKTAYGMAIHMPYTGNLEPERYISGGNIFFRRAVLERVGGFNPVFGMSGKQIAYGEETALLKHIREHLPQECLYYDLRLFVLHLVAARKKSLWWVLRQRFAAGRDAFRIVHAVAPTRRQRPLGQTRAWLVWQMGSTGLAAGLDLLYRLVWRDRARWPYIENYFYEHTGQSIRKLGRLYEQYRQKGILSHEAQKNRLCSGWHIFGHQQKH